MPFSYFVIQFNIKTFGKKKDLFIRLFNIIFHYMNELALRALWFPISVYNLMFMGLCAVELLTGPSAIERTVELLRSARELPVLAPVTFKVNPQGITLTDNNRK